MDKLVKAVVEKDLFQIKRLVSSGYNVNIVDNKYGSPLLISCSKGSFSISKLLINNGANVNMMINGFTPLDMAILNNHTSIAKYILLHCDVNKQVHSTIVHHVACIGNIELGNILHTQGYLLHQKDDAARIPLHWAVQEGRASFVRWLLSHDSCIDIEDEIGLTPLMIAAARDYYSIVVSLVEKGADVNHCSSQGTALHYAFAWNHLRIIDYLIQHNAKINVRDSENHFPIWYAVNYRYLNIVRKYFPQYCRQVTKNDIHDIVNASPNKTIKHLLLKELKTIDPDKTAS